MRSVVGWRALMVFILGCCSGGLRWGAAEEPARPARPAKIEWTESLSAALDRQKKLERPVLVYVGAGFCGYCRQMDRETWTDPSVIGQLQERFIALRVDADQQPMLVERLGIESYPTTIVFSVDGRRTQTLVGFVRPQQLLRALADAVPRTPAPSGGD
jgi:thioredoxin-like negative regulator of GroEL